MCSTKYHYICKPGDIHSIKQNWIEWNNTVLKLCIMRSCMWTLCYFTHVHKYTCSKAAKKVPCPSQHWLIERVTSFGRHTSMCPNSFSSTLYSPTKLNYIHVTCFQINCSDRCFPCSALGDTFSSLPMPGLPHPHLVIVQGWLAPGPSCITWLASCKDGNYFSCLPPNAPLGLLINGPLACICICCTQDTWGYFNEHILKNKCLQAFLIML